MLRLKTQDQAVECLAKYGARRSQLYKYVKYDGQFVVDVKQLKIDKKVNTMATTKREMKEVKTRDAAVTILRKLGLGKEFYNECLKINKTDNKLVSVIVDITMAKAILADAKAAQINAQLEGDGMSEAELKKEAEAKAATAKKQAKKVEFFKETFSKMDKSGNIKAEKPPKAEKPSKAEKPAKAEKPVKAEKPTKTEKPPKAEKKVSVSQAMRDLIIAGKTNDEVWAKVKEQFNLDDSKKHYPAWYRSDLKKKGLIK